MIGVFDSGFGGLTVLKEIIRELPDYSYIYLGDSARAPYGPKSQEEVYEYTKEGVEFLFNQGCKLVILACNTASSDALRKLQKEYLPHYNQGKRILGVLIPAAEEAINKTKNGKIGVIGTEGTIRSGSFEREILKLRSDVEFFGQACPELVPIIESGEEVPEEILKEYLNPLIEKGIDILILGCTHYGVLEDQISEIVGPNINLIISGESVAPRLADYLRRHKEFEKDLLGEVKVVFYTTGDVKAFQKFGSKFYGSDIKPRSV